MLSIQVKLLKQHPPDQLEIQNFKPRQCWRHNLCFHYFSGQGGVCGRRWDVQWNPARFDHQDPNRPRSGLGPGRFRTGALRSAGGSATRKQALEPGSVSILVCVSTLHFLALSQFSLSLSFTAQEVDFTTLTIIKARQIALKLYHVGEKVRRNFISSWVREISFKA